MEIQTICHIEPLFDDERYLKIRMRLCHDGFNRNTHISLNALKKAQSSIVNIPLLASVVLDRHGRPLSFLGHDFYYSGDKAVYKETPIGLIPETCNYCIEPWNGHNYVFVDGYVWRTYCHHAEEILERDLEAKISMEAQHTEKKKELGGNTYVHNFLYRGVTFINPEFEPAMKDAHAFVCKEKGGALLSVNKAT